MSTGGRPIVYRISPWRRGLFAGLGGLIMLPMLIGAIATGNGGFLAGMLIVFVIWAPCYYLVHAARIILSEDGVQFRQVGYHLESKWENVAGLWLVKGQQGFELIQPMENYSAKLLAGTADTQMIVHGAAVDAVPGEDRRPLVLARRFIPIEAFAYYVENGNLLEDIRRFAPQIADQPFGDVELQAARPHAEQTKSSTGSNVLVAVLLIAAVVLGIAMGTDVLPENVQGMLAIAFRVVILLCIAFYAVYNIVWTFSYAREGRWGKAALAAVFAIIQVLFCLAILGNF